MATALNPQPGRVLGLKFSVLGLRVSRFKGMGLGIPNPISYI